jgi:hypothetical protein
MKAFEIGLKIAIGVFALKFILDLSMGKIDCVQLDVTSIAVCFLALGRLP